MIHKNTFFTFWVPSVGLLFHEKSCQTYIIVSQEISKAIPNAILRPATPLTYKPTQHVITDYEG